MTTFSVSQVEPSRERLAAATAANAIDARTGSRAEASAANLPNLVATARGYDVASHPLVEAASVAFASHYPLTLSPDDIWLCIAQGLAAHLDVNAEALRTRLVRHEGKTKLTVRRDDFIKGSSENPWPDVFSEFSGQIAAHVGKMRDLVVAGFSTTGAIERAASEVALMSAMRHYFEYDFVTLCGFLR